jgi:hypothetical protein
MRTFAALVLVALAAGPIGAQDAATPRGADPAALLQPGPAIEIDEFRYARPLPSGPRELVAVRLDEAVLAHSAFTTTGAVADLRVVDQHGRQVPYLLEKLDDPLRLTLTLRPPQATADRVNPAPAESPGRRSAPQEDGLPGAPQRGRSLYVLRLPHAGLPAGTLVLHTSARVFRREVEVEEARRVDREGRSRMFELGPRLAWRHEDAETAAPPLAIDLPRLESDSLQVTVVEGDNPPLPITSVDLQLPAYRIRFERPANATLSLVYGRPGLAAPEYDLALVRPTVLEAPVNEIAAGPERSQVPASQRPALSRTAFWIILAFASIALLWMIATLVRMVGQDASRPGGPQSG